MAAPLLILYGLNLIGKLLNNLGTTWTSANFFNKIAAATIKTPPAIVPTAIGITYLPEVEFKTQV